MSAPVPLVIIGFLNWVVVGSRGVGDKVLGTVLDNTVTFSNRFICHLSSTCDGRFPSYNIVKNKYDCVKDKSSSHVTE